MGAYAQCAERLIERGFAAVPIMPGTKRPGFFFAGMWIGLANWQRRFNGGPPPATERERWAAGDTGVGVVAGQASHGLIAVDIDSEDPAMQAALQKVLPPTRVRKTGARGETLFYYGPGITQSQSWNIAGKRVVDLIGPGRRTVLRCCRGDIVPTRRRMRAATATLIVRIASSTTKRSLIWTLGCRR